MKNTPTIHGKNPHTHTPITLSESKQLKNHAEWERSEDWLILRGDCHEDIENIQENILIEGTNYGTIESLHWKIIVLGDNAGNILTTHRTIGVQGNNYGQLGSTHGEIIVAGDNNNKISTLHGSVKIGGNPWKASSHFKQVEKWNWENEQDLIYYIKFNRKRKVSQWEKLWLTSPHATFGGENPAYTEQKDKNFSRAEANRENFSEKNSHNHTSQKTSSLREKIWKMIRKLIS